MTGFVRLGFISGSAVSALACAGCMSVSSHKVTAPPMQVYEAGPARGYDAPQLVYTGTFEAVEQVSTQQTLAMRQMNDGFGRFNNAVTVDAPLSSAQLYSSAGLTDFAATREQLNLSPIPRDSNRMSAALSVSLPAAESRFGLDVDVTPRVSITRDGDLATRRLGGQLRIGQNFDKRGAGDSGKSWFLFAGADGEALVWEPDETGTVSMTGMALRDKVTVGDLQAGISFQQGPGQLSFSYIRREVNYSDRVANVSETENFAGLSFTIRR